MIASPPVMGFDAETASLSPLQTVGADQYTRHPSTRCLMAGYKPIGATKRPALWLEGDPVPDAIRMHIAAGGQFSGWNVIGFDRGIYNRILVPQHGWPALPDDAWIDSMHRAAHDNRPRSLDGCARSLGLEFQSNLKDTARIRRITNLAVTPLPALMGAILRNPGDYPAKLIEDMTWLAHRCVQDVELEEAVLVRLSPWPVVEPWLNMPAIDRRINDRGILIDTELVAGLAKAATYESHRLNGEIKETTRGAVPKHTQTGVLKEWLVSQGVPLPLKTVDDDPEDEGEDDPDDKPTKETVGSKWRLRKSDLADLLARSDVPDHCRTALEIRAEAAKASVAKLRRMLASVAPDGRLRGAFMLGGAQQTLRWSAILVQVHNLVRDVFANPDEIAEVNNLDVKRDRVEVMRLCDLSLKVAIETGRTGDPELMRLLYTRQRKDAQGRPYTEGVIGWISRMLRRTLCAPAGSVLLNGDFAQIEARIPMWLSGQEDKVQAYGRGEDMYRRQAAPVFGLLPEQLSKTQRQIGKVQTLFCGFGGGVNAFVPMAMNYGIRISREEAMPAVQSFRDDNPMLVKYWYNNLAAARYAVTYPGQEFWVPPKGLVSWFMKDGCLLNRLPSGRCLRYWNPELKQGYWADGSPKETPDLTVWFIKGRAVFRRTLWHGLSCLSAESKVITCQGVKRLIDVNLSDRLWDGDAWVKHDGVIFQGIRETVSFGGVRMTVDHKVFVDGVKRECGDVPFDSVACSYARHNRSPDWQNTSSEASRAELSQTYCMADTLRLRNRKTYGDEPLLGRRSKIVWLRGGYPQEWTETGARHTQYVAASSISCMEVDERPLSVTDASCMGELRRSRDICMQDVDAKFQNVLDGHGSNIRSRIDDRAARQQRRIQSGELLLGNARSARSEQAGQRDHRYSVGPYDSSRSVGEIRDQCDDTALPVERRLSTEHVVHTAGFSEPVFDILNAGPNHRFAVVGDDGRLILVSNCENQTQAIAADLLANGLVNCDRENLPVPLHVHDSIAAEVEEDRAEGLLPLFRQCMLAVPPWAAGLPVAVEADISARFG